MGLRRAWKWIGKATRRAGGHPGGDSGEGDSAGGPKPGRGGPNDWPTLVIEAGYSETLRQLQTDMRWWFSASNHDAKIVLLAKFDRARRRIIVERWEEDLPSPRPGATTTRGASVLGASGLRPKLQQSIKITRSPMNPALYNVVDGPLVLPFRLLFLRAPGPGEHDVVISIPQLQEYATDVWTQV